MAKFKITEGAEKDFEGAPEEALVKVHLRDCEDFPDFLSEFKNGAKWFLSTGSQTIVSDISEFTIIAQREPIVEPAPDADGWIEWSGGECPVLSHELVFYKMREEEMDTRPTTASTLRWKHKGIPTDIIAYRPSKPEVAESPAWDGKSIPPVGNECEYKFSHDDWAAGEIKYISDYTVVIKRESVDSDLEIELAFPREDVKFRPIRSAEEIECDKAFGELYRLEKSMPDGYQPHELIDAIISAGYRKVK